MTAGRPSSTVEDRIDASLAGHAAIDQILDCDLAADDDVRGKMRGAIRTLAALVSERRQEGTWSDRIDKRAVDALIAEHDRLLSDQMDRILHHPSFQTLESAWRGLKLLVDRADFRENTQIEILACSKDELIEDFEDATEIKESGLYKHVFTAEFGQFGGNPHGAVIGDFAFGPRARDMKLLQNIAAVSAMAHAPFVAGADPQFFSKRSFRGLPAIKDIHDVFAGPASTKWRSFRESDDARWVGLTLPRFLLRHPYNTDGHRVKGFDYSEDVTADHENYLWGNAAYAFAANLVRSFAQYRWCANIIGPQAGGAVHDLPVHVFQAGGRDQAKIPTEVLLSNELEKNLADAGFIGLTMRKHSDDACFFSANSCQKPKTFGTSREGKQAELNAKLSSQLPYIFVVSRLAHYIKAIQVENLGRAMTAQQLESELNTWVRQYVLDQDVATPEVFAKRPLRRAAVTVEDIPGEPGWYRAELKATPHFKYMGAYFELSLVGKLKQSNQSR